MDKRIQELRSNKCEPLMSLGIYFADVNGLKQTNDTSGHEAGDRLLISAADLLKETFDGYEMYRVGGDEFMVLCPNMDEKDFNERLEYIRNIQKKRGDVILAIGGKFAKDTTKVLDDMKQADIEMYENKKLYYESVVSKKA